MKLKEFQDAHNGSILLVNPDKIRKVIPAEGTNQEDRTHVFYDLYEFPDLVVGHWSEVRRILEE